MGLGRWSSRGDHRLVWSNLRQVVAGRDAIEWPQESCRNGTLSIKEGVPERNRLDRA